MEVRVGGRRLSQSHPLRSPTKAAQGPSPSTSPEEASNVPHPIPDYPRPKSPQAATVETEAQESAPAVNAEEEIPRTQSNRQERRRQERKKDNYQTEEDKDHVTQQAFGYDAKAAHKEGKGSMGMDKFRRAPGTAGSRITQPAGKFMS
ncbi:hypothetical protein CBS101457_001628 [Exobasidium rhododendri]|nr:hypothetical protein CBS101457_001628 [Exobasidium rhododendri]